MSIKNQLTELRRERRAVYEKLDAAQGNLSLSNGERDATILKQEAIIRMIDHEIEDLEEQENE